MKNLHGYSISIVSQMLGITPQTIRLYEQKGLIEPARTPGKTRLYSDEDVLRLKLIRELTKEMGVNLAGVEIVIKLKDQLEELLKERERFLSIIYEAGEMVQMLLEQSDSKDIPIKSSLGFLVKYTNLK